MIRKTKSSCPVNSPTHTNLKCMQIVTMYDTPRCMRFVEVTNSQHRFNGSWAYCSLFCIASVVSWKMQISLSYKMWHPCNVERVQINIIYYRPRYMGIVKMRNLQVWFNFQGYLVRCFVDPPWWAGKSNSRFLMKAGTHTIESVHIDTIYYNTRSMWIVKMTKLGIRNQLEGILFS